MRVQIDSTMFHLDLEKVSQHLISWYEDNKHYGYNMKFENGKTLDFSPKSIARIALKTALVPIALPTLKMLYGLRHAELPKHTKHEDMIDYCVVKMLGFVALLDKDYLYVETTERDRSNSRSVISISTNGPRQLTTKTEGGTKETETEVHTGGETYIRSGEDRYGENQTDNGGNQ